MDDVSFFLMELENGLGLSIFSPFSQEHEDHAVYRDARIVDIQRRSHDSENCSCIFVVRFDHDFFEVNTRGM